MHSSTIHPRKILQNPGVMIEAPGFMLKGVLTAMWTPDS